MDRNLDLVISQATAGLVYEPHWGTAVPAAVRLGFLIVLPASQFLTVRLIEVKALWQRIC